MAKKQINLPGKSEATTTSGEFLNGDDGSRSKIKSMRNRYLYGRNENLDDNDVNENDDQPNRPLDDDSEKIFIKPEITEPNDDSCRKESQKNIRSKNRKIPPNPTTWSSNDDDDDHVPSYMRKTAKGGYAHTNKSKLRISLANQGNTPWNKGKNRSSAVKAKIQAGVQARNRAVLLEKLKILGMTEEEWKKKKKEIKYLRERLRRAKHANNKLKATIEEQQLQDALKKTELSTELSKKIRNCVEQKQHDTKTTGSGKKIKGLEKLDIDSDRVQSTAFPREIQWEPIDLDQESEAGYGQKCPNNGPGGLICCGSCTAFYSKYLTRTNREMETQRACNIGSEVKELIGFLTEAQTKLNIATEAAKVIPPPPRMEVPQTSVPSVQREEKISAVDNFLDNHDLYFDDTDYIQEEPPTAV